MDKSPKTFPKRKRKRVTTNLTTSKKSRRYRLSRCGKITRSPKKRLSTDSSDTGSSTGSQFELYPQNTAHFHNYYYELPKEKKTKSTQCFVTTKHCVIQNCAQTRSKLSQTVAHKTLKAESTQTTDLDAESALENTLLTLLRENNSFSSFAQKIHKDGQTRKFVNCIRAIGEGKLETTNLSWKAFLDIGTLFNLESTTQMEYDPEWLEFCQVLYHMFGAGVINALRGRGHFSHVTSKKTKKKKKISSCRR